MVGKMRAKGLILSSEVLRKICNVIRGALGLRKGLWKGAGFGVTSGVITTLGVIIGLHSGTQSKLAVLVGIIVLAIADALSDAMGIHVSEESEMEHTTKEVWESSFFTFLSKLLIALSFIVPVQFLDLYTAILASVFWGLIIISVFSFYMAKSQEQNPYKVMAEHVLIAALVVILAHYTGDIIHEFLKP
jgi:VIT1/CCC1 family predicted Fe2+/Mn2+ transporter